MQSGAWSAIGFPVEEEKARKIFYAWANMCYQVLSLDVLVFLTFMLSLSIFFSSPTPPYVSW
jgi:hypothetical protein